MKKFEERRSPSVRVVALGGGTEQLDQTFFHFDSRAWNLRRGTLDTHSLFDGAFIGVDGKTRAEYVCCRIRQAGGGIMTKRR